MDDFFAGSPTNRNRLRRVIRRWAPVALMSGSLVVGFTAAIAGTAGATPAHTGCAAVSVGESSGWCGLYPGNATGNTKELGQVTVSGDGQSLVIQTEDASSGAAPATSFACLTATDPTQITHRLQDTQCGDEGGVWLPFTGGSLTVDLTAYPQFLDTQFTVQVAANADAGNANGDAFYNNFSVSTVPSGENG
ncbi:MAG: hypothetical protein ACLPQS_01555 [Acidimicrobiales bacterium]